MTIDHSKKINEDAADKIRKYRTDYNNNTVAVFIPPIPHSYRLKDRESCPIVREHVTIEFVWGIVPFLVLLDLTLGMGI